MDKFSNLPAPMKWFLGATGLTVLLSAGWLGGRGGWKLLLIFAAVLAVLLLVLVGGYLLWSAWKRKKHNAQFGGDLQQSTTAAPRGMSANDLAKLDSLRKKFQEGVEAFRSRGKNIYTLPWYVIIGEPGSGKTEAIRRCNVGFPPGMHEGENDTGYMGAGGTINMNWWFTNYAVLLDTAGRLVFEDVKAGETSEWKEFLKLLKKNRPNCPVNGLLLVIPSDSLIRDSVDQISAKAGKIAQQLDLIQRVLDFRFPVYISITKSDKINGFREFFENVTDPQLQHQIMGWSNPDSLDTPFKPDIVDKHLTQVADRLRRRRLGLLRNPVPESAPRRVDEVDSLYALPNSLVMLAPRLRKYLETIFMPGEWSAKPLFLRGIYFTSSMREGAALDQELAEAIGVSAEELPEGKVWERDRAYFLKDLFMEKVFREKGLVTRATNTGAMLRRRQMFLYASIFVALSLFLVITWLGKKTIGDTVADRAKYWVAAKDAGWLNGTWSNAIVLPDNEGGYYAATNRYAFSGQRMTLSEFHQRLRSLAENELKRSWTMPGLAAAYNDQSKVAQRVVFETGVMKPLRDGVARSLGSPVTDYSQAYQAEALAGLLRLEADIQSRRSGQSVEIDTRAISNSLGCFSRFLTGHDFSSDSNLVQVMLWTYGANKAGQGAWPPAWLSTTVTNNGVVTNLILQAGLDYCLRAATNAVRDVGADWTQVTNLQVAFRSWDRVEREFLAACKAGDVPVAGTSLRALKDLKMRLERLMGEVETNSLFKPEVAFAPAVKSYTNSVMDRVLGVVDKVEKANAYALGRHPGDPVFLAVAKRLQAEKVALSSTMVNLLSAGDADEFSRFDRQFLAKADSDRLYTRRWNLYQRAASQADTNAFEGVPLAQLLGALNQAISERAALEKDFKSYSGYAAEEVGGVARLYLSLAETNLGARFTAAYRTQADKLLEPLMGFPLLRSATKAITLDGVSEACGALKQLSEPLKSDSCQNLKLKDPQTWKAYAGTLESMRLVAEFLKGKEGKSVMCSVTLRKAEDISQASEKWRRSFRGIQLVADGSAPATSKAASDEESELGKIPLDRPCRFHLYNVISEANPAQTVGEASAWGALLLVFKNEAKPEKQGDFKNWFVPCKFKVGGEDYVIPLRISFEEPLPELSRWPASPS
jgi:hypothetical protein